MPTTKALITQSLLTDIADAIRATNGSTDEYTPAAMATAIAAIPTGGGGGSPTPCRYSISSNGEAVLLNGSINFPGIKSVPAYALYHLLYWAKATSISFPDLETVADYGCNGLNDANTASAFPTNVLTSISFPKLKTIGGDGFSYAFRNQNQLLDAAFPELTTLDARAFNNTFYKCSSLRSVTFPKLQTTGNAAFTGCFNTCTGLTSISFPALTSPNSNTFSSSCFTGCSNLTAFHFRADMQTTVEAMSSYNTLWGRGAGNATVYFDL